MNLIVKELGNSRIWFSSDYHFNHANIIKYCNRPFDTVEEMDREIISRHNEKVRPDDLVICLGDVAFKHSMEYLSHMNGNFIYVRGNHDDKMYKQHSSLTLRLCYGKYKFLCVHKPESIFGNFTLNIVGHVHEKWVYRNDIHALNVGVDVHNFYPVSLKDVIKYCH